MNNYHGIQLSHTRLVGMCLTEHKYYVSYPMAIKIDAKMCITTEFWPGDPKEVSTCNFLSWYWMPFFFILAVILAVPFLIWKENLVRVHCHQRCGSYTNWNRDDITTHAFSCMSTQRTTSNDSGFSTKSGSGKDLQDEATLAILLLLSEENQQLYFERT